MAQEYEDIIEEVKSRSDIVDVIGRQVVLKRAGNNFKGLCPFHGEKTPSFVVSPEKQIFTCFGCGVTGDVIEFVKKTENLDFMEAVEKLANEHGIQVKHGSDRGEDKKAQYYDVTKEAARFFYQNLRSGENPGVAYILKRGIDPKIAKKFGIGYASQDWHALGTFFKSKGIEDDILSHLGLIAKGKQGYYDKFRDRIIFPIINTRGKVIGFGGRAIGDEVPKYLNSSESIIFKKKDNLYALNLAKNEISKKNQAILVEGYMDALSLHQHGIENAVATLGTALTSGQAKLLKRYADEVILAYDSDEAGQAATLRGIDILQEAGLNGKVLILPEGKDPDEYIRKNGRESFEKQLKMSIFFMEYKMNRIKSKYDMNTTEGSIRFLEEISKELSKIDSPVKQDTYIQQIAKQTKIPASSIQREVDQKHVGQQIVLQPLKEKQKETPLYRKGSSVCKNLIRLMLSNGEYVSKTNALTQVSDYLESTEYAFLYQKIKLLYKEDTEIDIGLLKENLDEHESLLLEDVMRSILPDVDEEKAFIQCVEKIEVERLSHRRREILDIMQVLDEEHDGIEIETLTKELMKISELIKR